MSSRLWLHPEERKPYKPIPYLRDSVSEGACGKASEWEQALQLFGDMEDHRGSPEDVHKLRVLGALNGVVCGFIGPEYQM